MGFVVSLIYGVVPAERLGPVLGIASITALLGAALMLVMAAKSKTARA